MLAVVTASTLLFACNSAEEKKAETTEAPKEADAHAGHNHGPAAGADVKEANATISGTYADTAVNGTAKFVVNSNGTITLDVALTIPAKAGKSVAVHMHEHGDCGEHGMASHGHWNPTGDPHGQWGSDKGFHLGDIGNVTLDAEGKGTVSIKETNLWSFADAKISPLGKAIIVHGGTDDYTTQPTGNAGNRIGCGVIQ